MRCRVGDLAFVVGAPISPENNGALVRIVRAAPPERFCLLGVFWAASSEESWIVETEGRPLATFSHGHVASRPFLARFLRPIRDQDGEDEMLRITGLPQKEVA
jgi:hypothetical protein